MELDLSQKNEHLELIDWDMQTHSSLASQLGDHRLLQPRSVEIELIGCSVG